MYQTIGHTAIAALAQCLRVPLFQRPIRGKPLLTALQYSTPNPTPSAPVTAASATAAAPEAAPAVASAAAPADTDEVEDLLELVRSVQRALPAVQAVSSGAILSNYQRTRVENVYGFGDGYAPTTLLSSPVLCSADVSMVGCMWCGQV
jgi:diphthine-ammonia ligase